MKVLLVNKFHYRKGGSETYYFTLAETLEAMGHQAVFFSMEDERNLPCPQAHYFVSHVSTEGGLKNKLALVRRMYYSKEAYVKLSALLLKERPDLVVLNLVHKHLTLSVIDAIRQYDPHLPIFWTMHDLIAVCPAYSMLDGKGRVCRKCLDGDFRHCVREKCIRGSRLMSVLSAQEAEFIRKKGWYRQVDLFICPSEFHRDLLAGAGFTSAPILTLRNPLPLDTSYECNDGDDGYVLYFGRLVAQKGVATLIRAAQKTNFPLVICGTGPDEEAFRHLAAKGGRITFKGFQTGQVLLDIIRRSRCVVLSSEGYENGPYSAMEAMALGKPLVVSDLGGLPELVEPGENGYVYPAAEGAEALAAALEQVFALTPADYSAMCRASLARARAMFDPRRYVERLMEYYEACTGRPKVEV
ncbi:glycosyltransferase family 4 protein [Pseudoflavonifractor phocaeensis]|uniref:glycosyltransferase family 4 protein n=1 Tax=Pseudoflavonifractor phocaeensis TaxID=1870988 RepID=UPI00195E373E|nr:glycosyltransferase family 4 protein [Pseudoflavonifractor phocaeensis]